jgi:hypothetical protein
MLEGRVHGRLPVASVPPSFPWSQKTMDRIGGLASRPAFLRVGRCHAVVVPLLFAATLAACGGGRAQDELGGVGDRDGLVMASTPEAAGRYLVRIGGCNDCHTDGFAQQGEAIPEAERLKGSIIGFRGPWGTTYPANLRLSASSMTEDQWVEMLTTRTGLPPMPWTSVNQMSQEDQRAIYRYLRSLGTSGPPATAAIPPDVEPVGPWIDFVPKGIAVAGAPGESGARG